MKAFFSAIVAALVIVGSGANAAEQYPTRPIRMIVPFAPGGGSDVIARLVASKVGPILGQSVLVENRPGASGIIGADIAAKAAPDGYTILMANSALASNPFLYDKLPYDTAKDLIPVIDFGSSPTLLAAHPSAPFDTMPELVKYAKENPDRVTVGTSGAGQTAHLVAEMISQASDTQLMMVHYKGTAATMNDLLGGTIMMSVGTVPGFINYIKDNRLKPIAVASSERLPALPSVPTVAESISKYDMNAAIWFAAFVPAGTPAPIIDTLHKAVAEALKDPDIRARFAGEGLVPGGATREAFTKQFHEEMEQWKTFIAERNIKLEG
jgi:tripartite-type tricarboxylate transporter receptor subunit TctC